MTTVFKYGYVYQFRLPVQMIPEYRADIRERREAIGYEMADGIHYCLVVSNDDFNSANSRGVVVVPMTSAKDEKGGEKFFRSGGPWVRIVFKGKPAYVLCEQIRYIDRRRHVQGVEFRLLDYDLKQVQKTLENLLLPPPLAKAA